MSLAQRPLPLSPPSRNVGAFRLRTPSRHCDSRPLWGRQSRRFLETGSLHPPLAALRLFPPHPLTTQRGGAAAPPLWKPHPGMAAAAEREAGPFDDHLESKLEVPTCGGGMSLFRLCGAHPVGYYQITWAPATTTPVFALNLTQVCQVESLKHFFFSTVHGAFSFWCLKKKMGGASPPGEAEHPPSPGQGTPNLLLNKRKLRITYV